MNGYTQEALNAALADLAESGGGTYKGRTLEKVQPTSGFAVGIGGFAMPAGNVTADVLGWAVHAVAGEFFADHVGTWLDDGTVYFDAVRIVPDLAAAIKLGYEHGEKAIYDFENAESIALRRSAS